jgi:IMP dehydrogenase
MKEYWGEGSMRAQNWQRYDQSGSKKGHHLRRRGGRLRPLRRENGRQPGGHPQENFFHDVQLRFFGSGSVQKNTRLTVVSPTSIVEGGHHDVQIRSNSRADQR